MNTPVKPWKGALAIRLRDAPPNPTFAVTCLDDCTEGEGAATCCIKAVETCLVRDDGSRIADVAIVGWLDDTVDPPLEALYDGYSTQVHEYDADLGCWRRDGDVTPGQPLWDLKRGRSAR